MDRSVSSHVPSPSHFPSHTLHHYQPFTIPTYLGIRHAVSSDLPTPALTSDHEQTSPPAKRIAQTPNYEAQDDVFVREDGDGKCSGNGGVKAKWARLAGVRACA